MTNMASPRAAGDLRDHVWVIVERGRLDDRGALARGRVHPGLEDARADETPPRRAASSSRRRPGSRCRRVEQHEPTECPHWPTRRPVVRRLEVLGRGEPLLLGRFARREKAAGSASACAWWPRSVPAARLALERSRGALGDRRAPRRGLVAPAEARDGELPLVHVVRLVGGAEAPRTRRCSEGRADLTALWASTKQ